MMMKNLFGIIFFVFSFVGVSAQSLSNCVTIQDEVYRYVNKTDEAKVCIAAVICDNAVQFYLSHTSVRIFYKLGNSVWVDHTKKQVKRLDMKNGFIAFITDSNIFMYKGTEL